MSCHKKSLEWLLYNSAQHFKGQQERVCCCPVKVMEEDALKVSIEIYLVHVVCMKL